MTEEKYEPGEGPITEDEAKDKTPEPSAVPDKAVEDDFTSTEPATPEIDVDVSVETSAEPAATPEEEEDDDEKQDQQTG